LCDLVGLGGCGAAFAVVGEVVVGVAVGAEVAGCVGELDGFGEELDGVGSAANVGLAAAVTDDVKLSGWWNVGSAVPVYVGGESGRVGKVAGGYSTLAVLSLMLAVDRVHRSHRRADAPLRSTTWRGALR